MLFLCSSYAFLCPTCALPMPSYALPMPFLCSSYACQDEYDDMIMQSLIDNDDDDDDNRDPLHPLVKLFAWLWWWPVCRFNVKTISVLAQTLNQPKFNQTAHGWEAFMPVYMNCLTVGEKSHLGWCKVVAQTARLIPQIQKLILKFFKRINESMMMMTMMMTMILLPVKLFACVQSLPPNWLIATLGERLPGIALCLCLYFMMITT